MYMQIIMLYLICHKGYIIDKLLLISKSTGSKTRRTANHIRSTLKINLNLLSIQSQSK